MICMAKIIATNDEKRLNPVTLSSQDSPQEESEPQKEKRRITIHNIIQKETGRVMEPSSIDWWNKNQPLSKWWKAEGVEKKRNSSWPKASPHLSNMVVFLLWPGHLCLPMGLSRWHLLMISPLTEATGRKPRYTGALCVLRFSQMHQNTYGDMSSFQSDQRAFQGEKVEYPQLEESIAWSQSDWAVLHLLKTRLQAERPHSKQIWRSI